MASGPVEIVVIAFPGNHFNGSIVPELEKLVEAGTISIIDGLFASKLADGTIGFQEFDELGPDPDVQRFTAAMDRVEGFLSDDDVEKLTAHVDDNTSAVILVFEHTWVKPLRDAVVGSGGVLRESLRVPGWVVDEIVQAVPEI